MALIKANEATVSARLALLETYAEWDKYKYLTETSLFRPAGSFAALRTDLDLGRLSHRDSFELLHVLNYEDVTAEANEMGLGKENCSYYRADITDQPVHMDNLYKMYESIALTEELTEEQVEEIVMVEGEHQWEFVCPSIRMKETKYLHIITGPTELKEEGISGETQDVVYTWYPGRLTKFTFMPMCCYQFEESVTVNEDGTDNEDMLKVLECLAWQEDFATKAWDNLNYSMRRDMLDPKGTIKLGKSMFDREDEDNG